MEQNTQPFAGMRVIDFTRVVSGPYATSQLAMLGADVIKIESPGPGDEARQMSTDAATAASDMAPMYMACGMNKRSVALNLKNPAAQAAVATLIEGADVVVENFRPGVIDRLGLGYEAMRPANPKLVWCAISGFGQTGPRMGAAAYDARLQAMSGMMSITGHSETGPTRAGFAVVDTATGMTAAFAIAAALSQRAISGKGQYIDVAMLDSILSFMAPTVAEWTVGQTVPGLSGNQGTSGRSTANLFRCRGGYLMLAANNDRQYQALANTIGADAMLTDPRFKDWDSRRANAEDLRVIIESALAAADGETWESKLDPAGVPASRVRDMASITADPQVAHRGLLHAFSADNGGIGKAYSLVGAPFQFASGGPAITTPPPNVGEHTEAVLRDLGLDEAEIAAATA
jgi:crotonobetainyl-CoA:carnitine CoA-transferase CaiB-like acyl-CoA transferase